MRRKRSEFAESDDRLLTSSQVPQSVSISLKLIVCAMCAGITKRAPWRYFSGWNVNSVALQRRALIDCSIPKPSSGLTVNSMSTRIHTCTGIARPSGNTGGISAVGTSNTNGRGSVSVRTGALPITTTTCWSQPIPNLRSDKST